MGINSPRSHNCQFPLFVQAKINRFIYLINCNAFICFTHPLYGKIFANAGAYCAIARLTIFGMFPCPKNARPSINLIILYHTPGGLLGFRHWQFKFSISFKLFYQYLIKYRAKRITLLFTNI